MAATIRRVRLALATRLLTQGGQTIPQVGLPVGYESQQAFTRAFGYFARCLQQWRCPGNAQGSFQIC